MLAITDVTKLSPTSLTTDHGQASLSPPLPEVFVISDKTRMPFRSVFLSLSLCSFSLFSTFVLARTDQFSLVQCGLVFSSSSVHILLSTHPHTLSFVFLLSVYPPSPYCHILFEFIYFINKHFHFHHLSSPSLFLIIIIPIIVVTLVLSSSR